MSTLIILLRLFLTFLFSMLFGLERQRAHKPIGFGTYTYVAVGACGLAITATLLDVENPLPLLGAIITGIGFLGAGALIKTGDKIFGFTSASTIWLFAIIGLCFGVGQYWIAIYLYLVVWLVIIVDRLLEKLGVGSYQRRITITTNRIVNHKEIRQLLMLTTRQHKLIEVELDKVKTRLQFTYLIEGSKDSINKLPEKLYEHDWFESCKIE